MSLTFSRQADFHILAFDSELTIFTVGDSYQQICQALPQAPEKVIVDLTALLDFDTAGLQLLLWMQQRWLAENWLAENGQLVITGADNPVVSRLTELYHVSLPVNLA